MKTLTIEEKEQMLLDKLPAVMAEAKRLGATVAVMRDGEDWFARCARSWADPDRFSNSLRFTFASAVWAGDCDVIINRRTAGIIAEISWSSTNRTVAMAVATVANYQKAIELAAYCEAVLNW